MQHATHSQIPDIPDFPSFDLPDDFSLTSSPSLSDLPAIKPGPAALSLAPQSSMFRSPVKIARAIRGESEVRLLVEKAEGKPDTFLLEIATLQPYSTIKTPLLKRGSSKEPLGEVAAIKVFNKTVATKYPAEKLRSGRSVSIHQNLL